MKKLSFLFNKLLRNINNTFKRFPLALIFIIFITLFLMYLIESDFDREIVERIIGVLTFGIPFSLCINLILEKYFITLSVKLKLIIYLIELLILYIYFMFFLITYNQISTTRLVLIIFGTILCFLFIPYLDKKKNIELYVTKIITNFTTSIIYSVVIGIGLSLVLLAIKLLLYANMSSTYFNHIWVLSLVLFNAIYFINNIPSKDNHYDILNFSMIFKIILIYIIMPILCIYSIVLYIYFTKIIITRIWPKGIVSYLVVSYTAISITSIFLTSIFIPHNRWVKVFNKTFTKIIFPLLIMMFISIIIRINEFGITENRYFILIIGIWSTFIMIFININKHKNNITILISLALVSFLTVCGPLSAFNVSKISQSNRLYKILENNVLIEENNIVNQNKNIISEKDKKEIFGVLNYFDDYHKLSDLKYLPENFQLKDMKSVFGFEYTDITFGPKIYFSFTTAENNILDIKDYDIYIKNINFTFYQIPKTNILKLPSTIGDIEITTSNKNLIDLSLNQSTINQFDPKKTIETLINKYGNERFYDTIPLEDMSFTIEDNKIRITYIINMVNGNYTNQDNLIELEQINFDVLINKIK